MKVDEKVWSMMKEHLEYSDDEMKIFRENSRNEDILAKVPDLMNKTIIFEVIESKGCNSKHKVGDKFVFDGAGNLLTKLNPKKVCIYALQTMTPAIFAINELVYAGVDPNRMKFNRAGCFDVGVKCGGWGNIVVECRVEDR